MTEQEAKIKWCPFVRMSPQCAQSNRPGEHPNQSSTYCIGSACMAWRWSISIQQANEINARGNTGAVASGYCGLSGKP